MSETRRKLTENQREVLDALVMSGQPWHRLMDIGAWNGSHHSTTVRQLARAGLAECRVVGGSMTVTRKTYRYRATTEGKKLIQDLRARDR